MKVYIITGEEYSDYSIYAVTLDKKQAELLKVKYSDEWNEAYIEEYDTDEYEIEVREDYKPMWNVEIYNNKIHRCYQIAHKNHKHGTYRRHPWEGTITIFVEAKDEEHAKKIAKDIWANKRQAELNNLQQGVI